MSTPALLFLGLRDANLAFVLALARSSAMDREEGRALIRGFLDWESNGFTGGVAEIPRLFEVALQQRFGPSASWLNADRSRLETVGVAFLIAIRKCILELARTHLSFAEATIAVADQHRNTIISNSTHPSSGAVSTLGHCLLTYIYPAFRDLERLQHCYRSFNSSPCGAGRERTGTRLPVDLDLLRTLLGFDELRSHSDDAVWQADGPIELMAAIVALLVNLNRLADDLRSMADTTGPIDVAWIRSLTSRLLAKVPVLASLGKEQGEDAEGCMAVADELCAAFDGAIRAIKRLVSLVAHCGEDSASRAKPEIHSAEQSDLVEVFVTRGGVDYPNAQKMAAQMDRLIAKGEIELQTLTPEAMDAIANRIIGRPLNLTAVDLASATEPERMISARRGPGGAAPGRVIEMITECRARLVRENLWVTAASQRLAKSEALLLAEAREVAGV